MSLDISRRGLLAASAAMAVGSQAFAAGRESAGHRMVRQGFVLNGNLVTPLDDEKPLDKETADQIRASGLTAMKQSMGGSGSSFLNTTAEMDAITKAIALNPDLLMQIRTGADFDIAKRTGRMGIIYSFESVEMLEGRVERIDHFAARGVRVMQLSYNLTSVFGSGVMAPKPSQGLTDLGRRAIARMNDLGITLDLAHADVATTTAALQASRQPALVTHAGCAAIYEHPRNKTDAVLKAVAAKGGVVGIYELSYLTPGPAQPGLDDYMAHMTHALKVCGEDHVGIGSDAILTPFDTGPESMAEWDKQTEARRKAGVAAPGEGRPPFVEGLNRPDRAAVIADALLKRGYRARTVEKVLGLNFRRVFEQTWAG